MEIVPMRDLKDTVKIENLCKENGKVFVTKNGYGSLVVMDIEYYDRLFAELEEIKAFVEGLKQAEGGLVFDGHETLTDIRKKYGL